MSLRPEACAQSLDLSSVFLDTGFFVAWLNTRDRYHQQALEIGRMLREGVSGRVETNDLVVVEALNWVRSRIQDHRAGRVVIDLVLGAEGEEPLVSNLHMTDVVDFKRSLEAYERYADQGLSMTDCSILATMSRRAIAALVSFDRGFDGLVEVVPARD